MRDVNPAARCTRAARLRRRLLPALAAVLVSVASATAAQAAPSLPAQTDDDWITNVTLQHNHSTGGFAATLHAQLHWLNRSVSVDRVSLDVAAQHRVKFSMEKYVGDDRVGGYYHAPREAIGYTVFQLDPFLLNGSAYVGGITRVYVCVIDVTHNGDSCRSHWRPKP